MKKFNLKKLTVTAILAAVAVVGKFIFLPGIRFKMCTGTASGKYFMRSYRRTVVGTGTGIYCGADP